jgi:hypothetical protein
MTATSPVMTAQSAVAPHDPAPLVGWLAESTRKRSWDLDFDAIRAHVRRLGLKLPLLFEVHESFRHRGGTVRGAHSVVGVPVSDDDTVPCHLITLRREDDADRVSRTLHHELTHAVQNEQLGPMFGFAYSLMGANTRDSYKNNPFEVEARAAAERNAHIRLAVERP